ncbi:MAG: hypothetical protein MUC96_26890 [Myxococcaceae bacterium]|jgi:hypothetical protein|nr:hypothetical protein [Myxococcaceae bacterium]
MKVEFRNTLWVALAAATLSIACSPPPPPPDGGTGGGGPEDSCNDDDQCPRLFRCSRTTNTCVPDCTTSAQCGPTGRTAAGASALDFCPMDTSCVCDFTEAGGECKARLCSADSDCGTALVCRSGQCVTPPAASTVTRCQVIPEFVVAKAGSKVKFWVSTWAGQEPVVIKDGATWSATSMSLFSMPMPTTGASTEFSVANLGTNGSNGVGVDVVQATVGTVSCTAKAVVIAAPMNGGAVVAVDELSGRPVAGARVIVSDAMGAEIPQPAEVVTNAGGVGAFTFGTATSYTVSVFHRDFTYVTVANYRPSGPNANVLQVAMRRNQVTKFGGFRGTFDGYPMNANIKAGVGGMSLAGAITNLNLTQLLGPSRPTRIKLGTTIDMMVNVPDGAFLVFSETNKNTLAGLGLNGSCTDMSGNADETAIRAGTCGTRSAWAFSGELTIGDLSPLLGAFQGGLDNIQVGTLLGQIQPLIRRLNSSIVRDIQFTLRDAPCKDSAETSPNCTKGYNYDDTSMFTQRNLRWANVPLGFGFALRSARMPTYRGTAADGALALTGVNVPGRGVIPLGLGAAVNTATPKDDILDKQETLPAAGLIPVRSAPSHSGTEGAEYGIIVAALSASALNDASAQVGASALFVRVPDNKLVFDPRGATPIDISTQAYPVFPEGGRFNPASTGIPGVGPRSFRFVTPAVATALGTSVQAIRVTFSDELEHRWDVFFDAARAAEGFALPAVPNGFRDRLFSTGMSTGKRAPMVVQAFRMSAAPTATGGTAMSFQDLVEFNATNMDRITNYLTGFGFLDYGVPDIKFKAAIPASVTKGTTKVTVTVEKFKIGTAAGDDGLVKLTFLNNGTPVAGCEATSSTELMAGNGEVELTVPAGCMSGAGYTAKAQLFYDMTTPVLPEVSVSQTGVTVQ